MCGSRVYEKLIYLILFIIVRDHQGFSHMCPRRLSVVRSTLMTGGLTTSMAVRMAIGTIEGVTIPVVPSWSATLTLIVA